MGMPWLQVSSPRTAKGAEAGAVEARECMGPETVTSKVETVVVMQVVVSKTAEAFIPPPGSFVEDYASTFGAHFHQRQLSQPMLRPSPMNQPIFRTRRAPPPPIGPTSRTNRTQMSLVCLVCLVCVKKPMST